MLKKILVLHPFIFALLPVFHLYSLGFNEYPFIVIVKPSVILLVVTLISLLLLNRLFKDEYKSAVIFSIFIIIFFMFGPLYSLLCLEEECPKILRFRYFLVLYFIMFTAVLFFFIKKRMNFKKVSNLFNLSGFIILLMITVNIISFLFSSINDIHHVDKEQKNITGFNKQFELSQKDNNLPNIYYVILDSYPNHENIKEILGFENKDFMDYLKKKGFFLINNSRSNYHYTHLSIPATLNMDYLKMEKMKNNNFRLKKNQSYYMKKEDSRAISYLESLGYNLFIDSTPFVTKYYELEFYKGLMIMTIMISPYIQNYISALLYRGFVVSTLNSLEKAVNLKEPFFVYEHIAIPHSPYMFDRYGNMPSFFNQKDVQWMFIEQLLYTNERIKKIIDKILSTSEKKPLIIIQGDHGPHLPIKDKEKRMNIQTGILNAVYLPDGQQNIFYNGMTSVNTFRVLFNKYFRTNLEILPDITYYQEKERGELVVYKPKNTF